LRHLWSLLTVDCERQAISKQFQVNSKEMLKNGNWNSPHTHALYSGYIAVSKRLLDFLVVYIMRLELPCFLQVDCKQTPSKLQNISKLFGKREKRKEESLWR